MYLLGIRFLLHYTSDHAGARVFEGKRADLAIPFIDSNYRPHAYQISAERSWALVSAEIRGISPILRS